MSVAETKKSVSEIGEEVKNNALKSSAVILQSAGDTTINSNKAYLMRMRDAEQRDVSLEIMWIEFNGTVYQLAGVSTPANKKVVHDALCSFKKSPPDELKLVNQLELQIVRSQKSETISQLSERTSNKLNISLTALINDLKVESPLDENRVVKIIRGVPYQIH